MYAVEMLGVTKRFGGNVANDNVTFRVKKGQVHSLLGENGAGKTTLMNILFGMYEADEGEIRINEKPAKIDSPLDAIRNGISMVHQHFMLVDSLTVAENIVFGNEPKKGILFDREEAFRQVQDLAEKYHFQINARDKIETLSVGEKQRVEIMKALYHNSSILILDEPTAVLTPQEVEDLFVVLKQLRADGKTIIIITHKLKETMELADEITVIRKGKIITNRPIGEVDENMLAELMVGHVVSFAVEKKPLSGNRPVRMELKHVTLKGESKNALSDISLQIRGGEILGIAGVEGNGQSELIDVITGLQPRYQGKILVDGKDVSGSNVHDMLHFVGHIPEDRIKRGFVKTFANWENFILGYHEKPEYMTRHGRLKIRDIRRITEEAIGTYDVRADGVDQLTQSLSGGNQQKLIIGRVLKHHTGIVLAAQPTRGVDVGAIEYIHRKLLDLRDEGVAVILISADLDEIVKLSDRIAVLYEGKIAAERPASEFDEVTLGTYMLGKGRTEGQMA